MNYELFKVVADFAALAVALSALGLTLLKMYGRHARETVTGEDMKVVWGVIEDLRIRLAAVEADSSRAPTHQDLSSLKSEIAGMSAAVTGLQETLRAMQTTLQQLVENELRGSRA